MKPLILEAKISNSIIDGGADGVAEAAALIRSGALVAFPTDTVYGVGADPFSPSAIARLYQAKNRDSDKGIPVLLADISYLYLVVDEVPQAARALMAAFWPGPLTLILPKKAGLPENLSREDTIAVRIPDNPIARRFIDKAGGAIAATSANRSGDTPACTAREALAALGEYIAAVLDGGPVEYSQASTILDCTIMPPKIIRPGPVSAEALAINS